MEHGRRIPRTPASPFALRARRAFLRGDRATRRIDPALAVAVRWPEREPRAALRAMKLQDALFGGDAKAQRKAIVACSAVHPEAVAASGPIAVIGHLVSGEA